MTVNHFAWPKKCEQLIKGMYEPSVNKLDVNYFLRGDMQLTLPQTSLVVRWGLDEDTGTKISSRAGTTIN